MEWHILEYPKYMERLTWNIEKNTFQVLFFQVIIIINTVAYSHTGVKVSSKE